MIVGKLKDIANYKGIQTNLDAAIDYILLNSWRKAVLGKTEIDHEIIYMNRFDYSCQNVESLDFEAHKNYIDIHLLVEGNEYLYVGDVTNLQIKTAYDSLTDSIVLDGEAESKIRMSEDNFAICFPEDAHMPKIKDKAEYVKKAVIKVKLEV